MTIRRYTFTLLFVLLLVTPVVVFAADPPFAPLAEYTGSDLGALYKSTDNALPNFLNAAFKILLSIGAMLAVLRLVYAGYMYMGSDMWSSKGRAREIIGNVVLGILLLLSIYLILYQINPDILNLNILRNVPQSAGGGFNSLQTCAPGRNPSTCISPGNASQATVDGRPLSCYRDPNDSNTTICQ